jgi:cyanophycinase
MGDRMAGDIGLVGGEEFRVGCEDMDREIMRVSGQQPAQVLVLPTAAVTGPAKAANDGVTHFGGLGGDARQLMVLDRTQALDPEYISAVGGAGVVYFTGGNPDHLLASLKDSPLLMAILKTVEQGTVLAGSSAGAMVLGSYMRRPSAGGWIEALGIVPGAAVMAHHENRDPAETSRELQSQAPTGLTVLGVDARTGCLGKPGNWRVVGSGKVTVYQGSEWAVYQSGDALPSDV